MRTLFAVPAAATVAAVALAATGCGTKTIDTGDLQTKLADQLAAQTNSVKPTVACPDDQDVRLCGQLAHHNLQRVFANVCWH